MISKQRQLRFAGVAGLAGPTRSPHSEPKIDSVAGVGSWQLVLGKSCDSAIQRVPLLEEHNNTNGGVTQA